MAKTNWNMGDTVLPADLNEMGQAINDAAAAAITAQAVANSHASRHAAGGPDEITPAMIGAETPAGAQAKADTAESAAKFYTDTISGTLLPIDGSKEMTGPLIVGAHKGLAIGDIPGFQRINYDVSTQKFSLTTELNGYARLHLLSLFFGGLGISITEGQDSPEGNVVAPVGSVYLRSSGVAGSTLYVKESGTGNTGWVAK